MFMSMYIKALNPKFLFATYIQLHVYMLLYSDIRGLFQYVQVLPYCFIFSFGCLGFI